MSGSPAYIQMSFSVEDILFLERCLSLNGRRLAPSLYVFFDGTGKEPNWVELQFWIPIAEKLNKGIDVAGEYEKKCKNPIINYTIEPV